MTSPSSSLFNPRSSCCHSKHPIMSLQDYSNVLLTDLLPSSFKNHPYWNIHRVVRMDSKNEKHVTSQFWSFLHNLQHLLSKILIAGVSTCPLITFLLPLTHGRPSLLHIIWHLSPSHTDLSHGPPSLVHLFYSLPGRTLTHPQTSTQMLLPELAFHNTPSLSLKDL